MLVSVTALAMGTQPTAGIHNLNTYIIVIQDKATESFKTKIQIQIKWIFPLRTLCKQYPYVLTKIQIVSYFFIIGI